MQKQNRDSEMVKRTHIDRMWEMPDVFGQEFKTTIFIGLETNEYDYICLHDIEEAKLYIAGSAINIDVEWVYVGKVESCTSFAYNRFGYKNTTARIITENNVINNILKVQDYVQRLRLFFEIEEIEDGHFAIVGIGDENIYFWTEDSKTVVKQYIEFLEGKELDEEQSGWIPELKKLDIYPAAANIGW